MGKKIIDLLQPFLDDITKRVSKKELGEWRSYFQTIPHVDLILEFLDLELTEEDDDIVDFPKFLHLLCTLVNYAAEVFDIDYEYDHEYEIDLPALIAQIRTLMANIGEEKRNQLNNLCESFYSQNSLPDLQTIPVLNTLYEVNAVHSLAKLKKEIEKKGYESKVIMIIRDIVRNEGKKVINEFLNLIDDYADTIFDNENIQLNYWYDLAIKINNYYESMKKWCGVLVQIFHLYDSSYVDLISNLQPEITSVAVGKTPLSSIKIAKKSLGKKIYCQNRLNEYYEKYPRFSELKKYTDLLLNQICKLRNDISHSNDLRKDIQENVKNIKDRLGDISIKLPLLMMIPVLLMVNIMDCNLTMAS